MSRTETDVDIHVGMTLEDGRRELFLATLKHCGWEIDAAARMLKICRKSVYNYLNRYDLLEDAAIARLECQRERRRSA